MKALVTGATGLVGGGLARALRDKGHDVRGLVRDPAKAGPRLEGIELVRGDVTDRASVDAAVAGCDWVFHAAGIPEQWQADPGIFDRVNAGGTRNVLEAALAAGVRRAVYTSTMDVFAAPTGGTLTEDTLDTAPKPTPYERSKVAADGEAERVRQRGLEVVHVNPSAVYGPGPTHVALNSFIVKLLKREVPMLPPGGLSVVYVDGVADAHIVAAERGRSGERYLVSDTFVTNEELAREVLEHSDHRKMPPTAPRWLAKGLARGSEPLARTLGFRPLIASGELSMLLWEVRVDASKARRELGFQPFAIADGVARTVRFLRDEGLVPR